MRAHIQKWTGGAIALALTIAGTTGTAMADPTNAGKVIITEIFCNPNDSGTGDIGGSTADNLEYIEIYNTTGLPIDISGWRLDDEDAGQGAPFPQGTILGAHQAIVIIGAQLGLIPNDPANPGQYLPQTARWTAESFNRAWGRTVGSPNAINVLVVPGNITIANTPTIFNEVPFLIDAEGDVVDIANYLNGDGGWPVVTAGQSISLRPEFLNSVDNDRGCAWVLASADPARLVTLEEVFVFPASGTPTSRDRLCDAGNQGSPGFVYNIPAAPTDCNQNGIPDIEETCGANATAPDCNGNLIPDSCEPDCNGNGIPDSCDVTFNREFQDCNLNGIPDNCDINAAGGVNGIGGTLDLNSNGVLDGCEDSGRVIITEIMVDPATGSMEWVEVQNVSQTTVDISGYRLVDIETGGDGYTLPVPSGNTLAPGEIAVLAALPATPSSQGGANYTAAEITTVYQNLWGTTTPQGQPIRWISLGRWGARATNATPNAEILTLVRGAVINDTLAGTVSSTSGPHPTRVNNASGIRWVDSPGFVVDVANYSNVNSNGEPLAGWPGSDGHSSFALLPGNFNATANNDGSHWVLSIAGINGSRASADLTGQPNAPFGFSNLGEDYGSPGYVPTVNQQPTGDVIITEIYATTNSLYPGSNPTPPSGQTVAGGRDEFVEILNTTNATLDLSGWYLQDEDGRTQPFPPGTMLPAHQAAIVIGVDTDPPTGTNQPNLAPLTGHNFKQEFYDAWGCGYIIIQVRDWYTNSGPFGLDRLADAPTFTNEILRLVKASGVVADIVNFDDDDTPSGIAQSPFGWPGDASTGVLNYWSIYMLPTEYTQARNDLGTSWAASLTGFDGGVLSVANPAVDFNNYPTGIFNRPAFGSPGFVQGVTPSVTPPGPACRCGADFNHSGTLTVQDIFDFLSAWFAGTPDADFNGQGGLTVQDIFDFLSAWFAGC